MCRFYRRRVPEGRRCPKLLPPVLTASCSVRLYSERYDLPAMVIIGGCLLLNPVLPRARIKVGTSVSFQQILFGPTSVTNGTQNFIVSHQNRHGLLRRHQLYVKCTTQKWLSLPPLPLKASPGNYPPRLPRIII